MNQRGSRNGMAGLGFTRSDLDLYLYGQSPVLAVAVEGRSSDAKPSEDQEKICQSIHTTNSVDILQLRYKPGVEKEFSSTEEFNKVMHTLNTMPPQLHLCYSSIPAAGFGICAKQVIPSGTWLGPYEGKRLTAEELKIMKDTRQVWEIYKNGVTDHYINGSNDSGQSSWMKYIQCARNTNEQNTVVFQFAADVYFQTYKKIGVGEELLVWYAEYYEQYLGIPVGVRQLTKTNSNSETTTRTNKPVENNQNNKESPSTLKTHEKPKPHSQQPLPKPDSSVHRSSTMQMKFAKIPKPDQISNKQTNDNFPQPIITKAVSIADYQLKQSTTIDQNNSDISQPNFKVFQTRFWKCEHCLVKFPQKWALQVHSCPCEVTQPYKCSHCGKSFVDKDDLEAHATNCASGRPYKCGYCGRSFVGLNTLTKHLKIHSKQRANGRKRRGRVSNYEKSMLQK